MVKAIEIAIVVLIISSLVFILALVKIASKADTKIEIMRIKERKRREKDGKENISTTKFN